MSSHRADTAFATLKDFQVDTMEYVLRRLYDDADATHGDFVTES